MQKTWYDDGGEPALVQGKIIIVFEEGQYGAGAQIALVHPYRQPSYLP